MKKFALCFLAGLLLFGSCGKSAGSPVPSAGWYVSEKDPTGPYVILNEDGTWDSSRGMAISYAVGGTYRTEGDRILAASDREKVKLEFRAVGGSALEAVSAEWKQEGVSFWIEPGDRFRLWDPEDDDLFYKVCTADEALALAREAGAVVMEGMKCTSGEDAWNEFVGQVGREEPASVLCAAYYTLDRESVSPELYEKEKNEYPKLFFWRVDYEDGKFRVKTRLSTEKELDSAESFPYLNHYTGKAPASARFSSYNYYVLADDPDVTWEDIERGMFSSQAGDWIRHFRVFSDISG